MKIIIEGDEKKVKQLLKELTPRCKRDKVNLKVDETKKLAKKKVGLSKK